METSSQVESVATGKNSSKRNEIREIDELFASEDNSANNRTQDEEGYIHSIQSM